MANTLPKEIVSATINLKRYTNVNEPEFSQDYDFSNCDVTAYTGPGRIPLEPEATDVELNFQGVQNAKIVVLHSSREFSAKINESATAIVGKTLILESDTGITSILLSNPDDSDTIMVDYFLADDATDYTTPAEA